MKEKVLFVIGGLDKGGAEKHVKMLAKELSAKGVECGICCISVIESKYISQIIGEVKIFSYGLKRNKKRNFLFKLFIGLRVVYFMRRVYREFKPDVIHYFLPEAYVLGAVAAMGFGCVQVMSRRSLNNYKKGNYFLSACERIIHKRMNMILANSRAVYDQILSEGVPDNKIRIIYNGVEDINVRDGASLISAYRKKSEVLVVCVANLIPYKGHIDLLRAFSLMIGDGRRNAKLLLVGRDDGIGVRLRDFAISSGLEHYVVFCGEVDSVHNLLLQSDLGILVSHEEGFSNAVLEGMAAGLPMIVSDVGGNAEAVVDKKTGLVVRPGAIDEIAFALELLVEDEGLRRKMGQEAKRRAQNKFSIDVCVNAYCQTYKEICR